METEPGASQAGVSLPTGGGAIRGIGETFQPNLFSGTGEFSVPIVTSPGRDGFGPQLALRYSSGHGNGPFGLGWQLPIQRVTRKTEKGLPTYGDDDVFVLSGSEDLVPYLEPATTRGDYAVSRYRPRTEGLFARIEKWVRSTGPDAGDIHWRTTSKDNVTSVYGKSSAARIADPADRRRIYEWLLQESFDDRGNHTLYEYARDDPNSTSGEIHEQNRTYAQHYPRRIFYGNSLQPVGPVRRGVDHEHQLQERERHYLFEVLFDYGDLALTGDPYVLPGAAQELATRDWPVRPDPFSTYRPGFEVRTMRRCRRVLMFHHFDELGGPTLVKSTDFEYEANADTQVSLLVAATVHAYRRAGAGYRSANFPPVTFAYSEFTPRQQRYQSVVGRGEDLPPRSLNDPDTALVDLFGTGLVDVLHTTPNGFRYWRNMGGGMLDRPRLMARAPAGVTLSQPGVSVGDMAGDGQADLLVLAGRAQGFYETTPDGTWQTLKPIQARPSFNLGDANVRLVDLTGDGLADALVTRQHDFVWFESRGENGYAAPRSVERVHDLNEFPDVFFDDPAGRVRLADMTGDGLADVVQVQDGRIDYWPNLGYGRFGKRITMAHAPRLDARFDPARLFLVDLDGSGCADLVYVDLDNVRFWFNRSGNSWSDAQVIRGTPTVNNATALRFGDWFGNGTTGLIWSYDADRQRQGNYKVLDFCGGVKPYLLTEMSNNLGATTRVRYAASTKYYLEDQANGTPWLTPLPFPVQVVDKVETIDHIGKTKLVRTFKYHHGYFDGREREFRGFGRVDQFDTEAFDSFRLADLHPGDNLFSNADPAHHVPPVETRTWFHTGVYFDPHRPSTSGAPFDYRELTRKYRREFYQKDAQAFRLADHAVEADDTPQEAYRVLRGAVLRTEVYGRDRTARESDPYVVTENRFRVRRLQARAGNHHAVYLVSPMESLTSHYDRQPDDPRVAHHLTVKVDDFGNVLQSVTIGYGRRREATDPLLTDGDRHQQRRTLVTYAENSYTNAVQQDDAYRAPLLAETYTYELLNVVFEIGQSGRTGLLGFAEVQRALEIAGDGHHDIAFENREDVGAGTPDPCRRVIGHLRTLYRRDDLSGPLPLGQAQALALHFESYKLALTPGLIARVYRRSRGGAAEALLPTPSSVLGSEGGYVRSGDLKASGWFPPTDADDEWWVPSGRNFYSPSDTDSFSQERAYAGQHFFLTHRLRNAFGQTTSVVYDNYDLLKVDTCDPVGNRVTVGTRDTSGNLVENGNDYRVLQPRLVMDANRNREAAAFDTLGLVVGTSLMGKPEEHLGDSLDGFETDLTDEQISAHLADPLADPQALLGRASTRLVHDLFAFQRTRNQPQPWAAVVYTLARETHDSDVQFGQLRIQHSLSYSDGFGREIQKKLRAAPGPVPQRDPAGGMFMGADSQPVPTIDPRPRWVCSGWTIFNNKGKPVRQYEPFFTDTHRFESEVMVGVSSVLFYDPVGRVVATLHPNHSWEKVAFDAWRQETWDGNDTVLIADPRSDAHAGPFFQQLAQPQLLPTWHGLRTDASQASAFIGRYPDPGDRTNETRAAQKAAVHASTPTVGYLDTLGRAFLTITHNRFERDGVVVEERSPSRVEMDVQGHARAVRDASVQNADVRGRLVMRYDYDLLGNRIQHASHEAGQRWNLTDATGKTIRAWDSRGQTFRTEFDPLRRPIRIFVAGTDAADPMLEWLTERLVYGEQHPEADQRNLRGRLYLHLDQAGALTTDGYDFKGNRLSSSRRMALDYAHTLSWTVANVALPSSPTLLLDPATLEAALAPRLQTETHINRTTYDALNRPATLTTPRTPSMPPSVIRPAYNEASLLDRLDVNLHGALANGQPVWTPIVTHVEYDAKAQRQRVEYGNGARTCYAYDPLTYRLVHLLTQRPVAAFPSDCPQPPPDGWPGCQVQNLHYTFDPVGNITHIRDAAQQTVYFRNRRVEPDCDFTYDAVYRLIEATGREHLGQTGGQPNAPTPPDAFNSFATRLPYPGDGTALGNYIERYTYGAIGNIVGLQHRGSDPSQPGWTRTFGYSEPSQLETGKVNNRLSATSLGTASEIYRYDGPAGEHGDMTAMPHLPMMRWDHRDRLRATSSQFVVAAGATPETTWYVYDAGGNRVRKVTERQAAAGQTPTRKMERLYLGGFEIYREFDATGAAVTLERETLHVLDGKQRIALVETRTLDTAGTDPAAPQLVRYQFGNHLGSAALELDGQAQIISYEEYSPYGSTTYQAVRSQTETPKRYRYTSKERDEETGLYYSRTRYYAPWLGRWISCDSSGVTGGIDLYRYATANPIVFIDPNGQAPKKMGSFGDVNRHGNQGLRGKGTASVLQSEHMHPISHQREQLRNPSTGASPIPEGRGTAFDRAQPTVMLKEATSNAKTRLDNAVYVRAQAEAKAGGITPATARELGPEAAMARTMQAAQSTGTTVPPGAHAAAVGQVDALHADPAVRAFSRDPANNPLIGATDAEIATAVDVPLNTNTQSVGTLSSLSATSDSGARTLFKGNYAEAPARAPIKAPSSSAAEVPAQMIAEEGSALSKGAGWALFGINVGLALYGAKKAWDEDDMLGVVLNLSTIGPQGTVTGPLTQSYEGVKAGAELMKIKVDCSQLGMSYEMGEISVDDKRLQYCMPYLSDRMQQDVNRELLDF